MLTEAQEKYLNTIPEDKLAAIKPWNPETVTIAKGLLREIKKAAPDLEVVYTGASALGLPGVNDIDFSILCPRPDFEKYLPSLKTVLGEPTKIGKENIRWDDIQKDGYEVDVHMTDPNSPALQEHIRLFEILKNTPQLLEEYKTLKEQSNGLPYREYQKRKYEFYNRALGINHGQSSGQIKILNLFWGAAIVALAVFIAINPQSLNFLQKYQGLWGDPYAHCRKPLPYTVAYFDQRFGLSEEKFLKAISQAGRIWEQPISKQLFIYNQTKGVLQINLIYDYRQAATETLKRMGIQIQNTKSSYDDLKNRYLELKLSYEQNKNALLAAAAAYDQRRQTYETQVQYWNSRGGAPLEDYNRLQQEKKSLDTLAEEINQKQTALNQQTDNVNAMVSVLNQLVTALNLNVQQYNTVGQKRGQEFQEGVYKSDANGRQINIYEFASRDQLVRVLAHELGHALGLNHVQNPAAIMYALNESKNQTLTPDDLRELKTECQIK